MAGVTARDADPGDPSGARIELVERDGGPVVVVQGELDVDNAAQLETAIEPLLQRADLDAVVFDVAGLTFMDSSGLAVLLRAASTGKQVRLRNAPPPVRQLVKVTGLDDVVRLEQ